MVHGTLMHINYAMSDTHTHNSNTQIARWAVGRGSLQGGGLIKSFVMIGSRYESHICEM